MATKVLQIFVVVMFLAGCKNTRPSVKYDRPSEYTITLIGHHFIGDLIEVRPSTGLEPSLICFHYGEAEPRQFKIAETTSDSVLAYVTGSVLFCTTNTAPKAITITTPKNVHTFPLMTAVECKGRTVLYGTTNVLRIQ
jgi:hypothetical protein